MQYKPRYSGLRFKAVIVLLILLESLVSGTFANPDEVSSASSAMATSPQKVYFSSALNFSTGLSQTYYLISGDFNGDGTADVAAADDVTHKIGILLGNGDGTFQTSILYPSIYTARGILTSDFNGDGKLDLAVSGDDTSNNGIAIFLGKGDGTFQTFMLSVTGGEPRGMAVKDFNGDGKLDLAVTNYYSTSISILLGKGDGTFQNQVAYTVGSYPGYIVAADFNGDGKLDLAVTNEQSKDLSVLPGNGDGTFQAATSMVITTGMLLPEGLAASDLNGDAKPDLAVAYTGGVKILLNNGNGTFQIVNDYHTNAYDYSILIADFNNDSKPDFATTYGSLGVYLGNGDGSFQNVANYGALTELYIGVAVDVNGDGKLDIATPTRVGQLSVFFGKGDGTFQGQNNFLAKYGPASIAKSDFNGDTKLDLVTANRQTNDVSVLLGTGNGSFQPANNYPAGNVPGSVTVGDFNGDGRLDLAVGNTGSATVSILLNSGNGTFQNPVDYSAGGGGCIAVADLNGDNKPDIITCGSVLLNRGDGTFQSAPGFFLGSGPVSITISDFNGDNKPDIAVANTPSGVGSGTSIGVAFGQGDGTFTNGATYTVGISPQWVTSGDLNGDGKVDLVTANFGPAGYMNGTVGVLLSNGNGTFQNVVNYNTGGTGSTVVIADFNSDGKPDLVASNSNGSSVVLFLGNGDGTFDAGGATPVSYYPITAAAGDWNGDGRPDIALTSYYGTSEVNVLLNLGPADHFKILAPASVNINTPVTIRLHAQTTFNTLATNYTGLVHFSSSDSGATLPADYSFVTGDGGAHTFSVTFSKPGNQTLTVSEGILTGSVTINVTQTCPNALNVNNTLDDGSCGSLRYALSQATDGSTINLNLTTYATITLKSTLTVPPGVTIVGNCTSGAPTITLDGTGVTGDGVVLQNKDVVRGLRITHFSGRLLVLHGQNNKLFCTRVGKNLSALP